MEVLTACSEIYPLLKTGGLADVCAALPPALGEAGSDVRVLLPGFPAILAGVEPLAHPEATLALPESGGPARFPGGCVLRRAALPGSRLPVYVLDAPALFNRAGNPYVDAQGHPWGDNALRFAWLGWAAACIGNGLDPHWRPSIVHCHDWHAGLAPLYLKLLAHGQRPQAASVFTIHNLAYQGVFPPHAFAQLGLPAHLFAMDGVEFHGQVSYMKAALQFADAITTVSPTYAREILTSEHGCGLEGLLRWRSGALSGILNGVDDGVWNPAADPVLGRPYDMDDLAGKAEAKARLQQMLGLHPRPDAPLFCVVSRLSEQKGLHLVADAVDHIVGSGGQFALLGNGERDLEQAFVVDAQRYPGCVAVRIGYDEAMSHALIAGSDAILVPSRFEPCGLTQLYGLRYGTLPIVTHVGGLADTVVDASPAHVEAGTATGIVLAGFHEAALHQALDRAFALYAHPPAWRRVQRQGMLQRFDWRVAAARYLDLFRGLVPAGRA